jgi:hypothetical protein
MNSAQKNPFGGWDSVRIIRWPYFLLCMVIGIISATMFIIVPLSQRGLEYFFVVITMTCIGIMQLRYEKKEV